MGIPSGWLVAFVWFIAMACLLPAASAAGGGDGAPQPDRLGVTLVPIAYHPHPDDADPLGVPYWVQGDQSWDYFQGAYARLDTQRDGFAFPSLVVDGIDLVEGLPGGDGASTLAAYREAWSARASVAAPVGLVVNATLGDRLEVAIRVEPAGPVDDRGLRLHWAIVEDDVYYRPPAALSNGVFVHRFTARAINDWPPEEVDVTDGFDASVSIGLDPDWEPDRLHVAVWVQNHDEANGAFALGEVVQATRHAVGAPATTQDPSRRGVLVEMFTATWCPSCRLGDDALDHLAREAGFASHDYREPRWVYLGTPQWGWLGAGGLAGGAVAAAAFRRRP